MLGMMNNGHGNDADLFYAGRKKSRTGDGLAMEQLRRAFGMRQSNDGAQKCVRTMALVDRNGRPELSWTALILAKRLARESLRRVRSKSKRMEFVSKKKSGKQRRSPKKVTFARSK